jgi:hypothetical protein
MHASHYHHEFVDCDFQWFVQNIFARTWGPDQISVANFMHFQKDGLGSLAINGSTAILSIRTIVLECTA